MRTFYFISVRKVLILSSENLAEPQPMLLHPGTTQFYHPTGPSGIINVPDNGLMELFCPGQWNSPAAPAGVPIIVRCTANNQFAYGNANYNFRDFSCSGYPQRFARESGARCYNNGYMVQHGYQVLTRFISVFESCHDKVIEQNYYTHYFFTPANVAFQTGK